MLPYLIRRLGTESRPLYAADTVNVTSAMTTLQTKPCSIVSLFIFADWNQRDNRGTTWLGHKRDELILLGRASLELECDVAA